MSTITTRSGKGSPLTNNEVDNNFTNLNTDKAELSGATFTGEIVANGGIALGDNDKATFGAGDDLQIYHDGTNSYIDNAGSGSLIIQDTDGTGDIFIRPKSGQTAIAAYNDNTVQLAHSGDVKLSTTSTGIDVTGRAVVDGLTSSASIVGTSNSNSLGGTTFTSAISTVGLSSTAAISSTSNSNSLGGTNFTSNINVTGTATMDGLTVSGSGTSAIVNISNGIDNTPNRQLAISETGGSGFIYQLDSTGASGLFGQLAFATNGTERIRIGSGGDVSFYEDTGTTPKMVWSASNEDLNFADSVKATFGAGDDLQIYHDGSNSIIYEGGTGDLQLRGNGGSTTIMNGGGTETLANFGNNGAVTLYHDNAEKLSTTSTGIDVTGTATMDGLTVDGDSNLGSTTKGVQFTTLGTGSYKMVGGNSAVSSASFTIDAKAIDTAVLHLATDGVNHLSIAQNGDVSFYEDTGTTPKFFWDASAESLGIGTSSPSYPLHVAGEVGIELYNGTGGGNVLNLRPSLGDANKYNMSISSYDHSGGGVGPADGISINAFDGVSIATGSSTARQERLRIGASGNVGIGTDSPDTLLHLSDTAGGAVIRLERNDTTIASTDVYGEIQFEGQDASAGSAAGIRGKILGVAEGVTGEMALAFQTAGSYGSSTERMRIDSSGNVGIGISSGLTYPLTVKSDANNSYVHFVNSTTGSAFSDGSQIGVPSGSTDFLINNRESGNVRVFTSNLERMRIDSSGNLLVGTTDANPTNNNTNSAADSGIAFSGGQGWIANATYDETTAYFNRTGTDGTIIDLIKSGTPVGSIRSIAGDSIGIGTGDAGLRFVPWSNRIQPVDMDNGLNSDGLTGLGDTNKRFKDLYLSNGVYLGGTGAANKLDDYEEGTFTPTVYGTATAGTANYAQRVGTYTKVGNLVYLQAYVIFSSFTGTSEMRISGLPFTPEGGSYENHMGSIILHNIALPAGTVQVTPRALDGQTFLDLRVTVDNAGSTFVSCDAAGELLISITYRSA